MSDIKTGGVEKGTVKVLDRSSVVIERMKSATIRTKDVAEQGINGNENSAQEYGANRLESAVETTRTEVVRQFDKQGKNGIRNIKNDVKKVKENYNKLKDIIKSKRTVKTTGKAAAKTTQKTVKTAQTTGKVAVKTSQTTVKAAETTAKGVKAAAKAAVAAGKYVIKAIVAAVKWAISAGKAIAAAIAAGGWVAVVVIIIICLIALIVGSCFGIFFSGEDTGGNQTMQAVVYEINDEYQAQIENIKNNTGYDVLEVSGSRAVWEEVLSVYAVRTTTDPDDAQDVVTMDDTKKVILKDIFWQMNTISSHTETKSETVITETDDGYGNIVQSKTTVTRTYLYITVTHKTADEMAVQLGFSDEQKKQLNELLLENNKSLWDTVLYGIHTGDTQIVSVALSQVGVVGGKLYWDWYGFDSHVDWCACFVSWCANECGYIDSGIIPKYAGCVNGGSWFKDRGQWLDGAIEPVAGMIIFFDWDDPDGLSGSQDGLSDHTGIVQKVENGKVYTVEGNSDNSVCTREYDIGYYEIFGYGVPAY